MAVITDPAAVRDMYLEFAERGVAVPCFCAENQRTIETILSGVAQVGVEIGVDDLPITVAFTVNYPGRKQAVNWTSLGDHMLGAKLCLNVVDLLAGSDGLFRKLRVLTLLDHGQPDADAVLLEEYLDRFSAVMYDASHYPFDVNMRMTAAYVDRHRHDVAIEGAVDEIVSEGGGAEDQLCTVERAQRFVSETGVDLIVPNLGTEHRATAEKAKYHGDLARDISDAVGKILVLHGTSSLGTHDIDRFKDDGIIKVNIWTRLARLGGQAVARRTLEDLGNILSADEIERLVDDGMLGPAFRDPQRIKEQWGGALGPKLSHFAEVVRRDAWVEAVAPAIKEYLYAFGYANYGAGS